MASAAPTVRDGDRAAKACNHVFIGNKGASGRARTQDERPVRFVAVGDVLRDRGGPRKAGKGARWAGIGRFRLAAEVTGKVTLLLLGRISHTLITFSDVHTRVHLMSVPPNHAYI